MSIKAHYLLSMGEKDEQVPALLSESLYQASQSKNKQLLIVEWTNPNTMFNSIETLNTYLRFITSISD